MKSEADCDCGNNNNCKHQKQRPVNRQRSSPARKYDKGLDSTAARFGAISIHDKENYALVRSPEDLGVLVQTFERLAPHELSQQGHEWIRLTDRNKRPNYALCFSFNDTPIVTIKSAAVVSQIILHLPNDVESISFDNCSLNTESFAMILTSLSLTSVCVISYTDNPLLAGSRMDISKAICQSKHLYYIPDVSLQVYSETDRRIIKALLASKKKGG